MNFSVAILINSSKIDNPNAPKYIMLTRSANLIGRQSENKIDTKNKKEISKHHATIYKRVVNEKIVWIIEDQNSLNGTFVNGRKVHRVLLKHGDEVVFGGGSQFNVGDVVETTELGQCRYLFFVQPPKVHFSKAVDINESIAPDKDEDDCPICYGPITTIETLPCGHKFCLSCIQEWSRACIRDMQPCVCPMCRAQFNSSMLPPGEAAFRNDKIDVFSIEPFLNALNIKSCKVLKSVRIFKKWKKKHSSFFWSSYNIVKDNDIWRNIFLCITRATLPYFAIASKEELRNAIVNLGGKPKESRDDLLREALLRFFALLIPIQKNSSRRDASKRIRDSILI